LKNDEFCELLVCKLSFFACYSEVSSRITHHQHLKFFKHQEIFIVESHE
jgi:hypothetical protein